MPLVVESQTAYDAWYAEAMKKPFQGAPAAGSPAAAPTDSTVSDTTKALLTAAVPAQPTH
jgi:hypothetical protein